MASTWKLCVWFPLDLYCLDLSSWKTDIQPEKFGPLSSVPFFSLLVCKHCTIHLHRRIRINDMDLSLLAFMT